jgi:DNA polymerase-3 subunit epsilon
MNKKREIVLDTETTGFKPEEGHKIIEIGALELKGGLRTGEYYHVYINPERDVPQEAYNVHGISSQFLKDKPIFNHIARDFLEFIGESPIIIHNAKFDMKFLNYELNLVNKPTINFNQAIDTLIMARKKYPGSPASLDALCKRFNIDLSGRDKHGALLDSELLADVYLELTGGRQVSMQFKKQKSEEKKQNLQAASPTSTNRPKRDFPISKEQKQRHNEFLKKIENPIWD